jgi:hypothetical protein
VNKAPCSIQPGERGKLRTAMEIARQKSKEQDNRACQRHSGKEMPVGLADSRSPDCYIDMPPPRVLSKRRDVPSGNEFTSGESHVQPMFAARNSQRARSVVKAPGSSR